MLAEELHLEVPPLAFQKAMGDVTADVFTVPYNSVGELDRSKSISSFFSFFFLFFSLAFFRFLFNKQRSTATAAEPGMNPR